MKHRSLTALVVCLCTAWAHADDYYVYFLGGQSNMAGYGRVSELPEDLSKPVDGARIFLGQLRNDGEPIEGTGRWTELAPGFGAGARTDAQAVRHSDRFGPELAFAARLRELRPDEKVAIIKYAKGGSGLDVRVAGAGTWDPHDARTNGINQYDHALATIDAAMRTTDIDGDGQPDRLIPAGILWMQGETDATNADTAAVYRENLAEMAELLRAAMRRDELPFVIGQISDSHQRNGSEPMWRFCDVVRQAQADVAAADPHASVVTTTDTYGYSDAAHYDTAGFIDLGRQFAEHLHQLRSK